MDRDFNKVLVSQAPLDPQKFILRIGAKEAIPHLLSAIDINPPAPTGDDVMLIHDAAFTLRFLANEGFSTDIASLSGVPRIVSALKRFYNSEAAATSLIDLLTSLVGHGVNSDCIEPVLEALHYDWSPPVKNATLRLLNKLVENSNTRQSE